MRKPFESRQIFTGEFDAIGFELKTTLVVLALAGFDVELLAGDVGEIDFVCIFIHQFIETALTTAVTERLPF